MKATIAMDESRTEIYETSFVFSIQPLTNDHANDFHRNLSEVAAERRWLAMLEPASEESTRKWVAELVSTAAPACVALDNQGCVIGWCDIKPYALEGFRHCGRLGMGVAKAWRGRGVGRQLLDKTVAIARKRGLTRIELEVFASNKAARALYDHSGFKVEGVKKRARYLDDAHDDVICMAVLW